MKKKVLIIGDSFTVNCTGSNFSKTHWLNDLIIYYDWEVTNLSIAGSSPQYVIDTMVKNFESLKSYDRYIFAWSEPTRFYHRSTPWMNAHEVKARTRFKRQHSRIYELVDLWYTYVIDYELEELKGTALQYWFDNYLSEKLGDKEIYHFYCFTKMGGRRDYRSYLTDCARQDRQHVYHQYKTGMSVLPTLIYYSMNDPDKPVNMGNDTRTGHLSISQHEYLFDRLKTVFDHEYVSGKIVNLNE